MGERFKGEDWYSEASKRERDPDVEAQEHLNEINRLLARLMETGGDLPGNIKQAIRGQIQAHLAALGLESMEDYAGLAAIQQRLYERRSNIPTPAGYPDKEVFGQRLVALHEARGHEDLPGVPRRPLATHVATYGQGDWSQLEGRSGKNAVEYLYDLGKVLSSELAYTAVFDSTDAIEIGELWRIENGRHRALTLRVLGTQYVEEKGINHWVTTRKEE
jgi:hypothetical protein